MTERSEAASDAVRDYYLLTGQLSPERGAAFIAPDLARERILATLSPEDRAAFERILADPFAEAEHSSEVIRRHLARYEVATTPAAVLSDPAETLAQLQRCPRDHPIPSGHSGCSTMGCVHWRSPSADEHDFRASHGFVRPLSDPAETLALIAKHRLALLSVTEDGRGESWRAGVNITVESGSLHMGTFGEGTTIGDAVRACVARIKGGS